LKSGDLLRLFLAGTIALSGGPARAAKPKSSLAYQYYSRGVELSGRQKWVDARKQFQAAIDLNPAYVLSYIEFARAAVMEGKRQAGLEKLAAAAVFAKSKEDKERLRHERENLSEIFYTNETFQQYQNGLNYLRLDRPGSAVEALERALKTESDNVLVLTAFARALRQEERNKEAIAVLERAFALNDGKTEVRVDLAEISLAATPEHALELLRPLRGRDTSERTAWVEAQALSALNRNREAIEVLRQAFEKNPGSLYAPLWLGRFYAQESTGAWNARKYLMTFQKRAESQRALLDKDNSSQEARQLKAARTEAEQILVRVNRSLE
jgi:tetratricopeptide (TPR) repeat protein